MRRKPKYSYGMNHMTLKLESITKSRFKSRATKAFLIFFKIKM